MGNEAIGFILIIVPIVLRINVSVISFDIESIVVTVYHLTLIEKLNDIVFIKV
jgi:hypothetical protein